MNKPNGVILYQGPSLIDGSPIVAVAVGLTTKSSNAKTGAMLQTYIIRSRIDPLAAVRTGRDASICGDCRHRGTKGKGRTCYVQVGQGPQGVYKAFKRGRYPAFRQTEFNFARIAELGKGRIVRLGTYGDPAAVPVRIWEALTSQAAGHTGYTHQWMHSNDLRHLCMASVDTVEEARQAAARGWRYFRVDMTGVIGGQNGEVLCPASKEAGKKLTCSQCLACGGADGRRSSIYIPAHGGFAVMANVKRFAGIPIAVNPNPAWDAHGMHSVSP